MSEEKVEDRVKKVEDTVLLIHYDLKALKTTLSDISTALSTLVDVQTKQLILEERYENRHVEQKKINSVIFTKLDDINAIFRKVAWIIITAVILSVLAFIGISK